MNTRQDILYTGNELNKIFNSRDKFNIDLMDLKQNNKFTEFENRKEDLTNILSLVMNKKNTHILIIGRTQDGKTYIMLKTIHNIINTSLIPITNIFIITGLSSKDWVEQMKDRSPAILHTNIFHRQDLKTKFVEKFKEIGKNIIINIDEAHIASSFKNTIAHVFKELQLDDKQYLYENNILIIEYTATPNGNIIDLNNTKKDNYGFYKLNKLPEYTGIEDLLNQNRVKECKDLYIDELKDVLYNYYKANKIDKKDYEDKIKLFNDIESIIKELAKEYLSNKKIYEDDFIEFVILYNYELNHKEIYLIKIYYKHLINVFDNIFEIKDIVNAYGEPSYVLIRTKTSYKQSISKQLIKQIFKEDETNFIYYDGNSYITLDILKIKPIKTTIIFIKEKLRCSITLYKQYISVLYDRSNCWKSNDDTSIQGLASGRSSGYDDNGKYIVFGDINCFNKYIELYEANFGDNSIIWSSTTTTTIDKITQSRGTYNNDECIKTGKRTDNKKNCKNILTKECKSYQEAQEFVDTISKNKHKIAMRDKDKNGYYVSIGLSKKPLTIETAKDNSIKRLKRNSQTTRLNKPDKETTYPYIVQPCYRDLNDINSLVWLVTYKDNL